MRFIHIADVHLGAKPDAASAYSPKRTQEIWNSFANIIAECRMQDISVLLIAGDLFHRQPLLRELKEVRYLFEQIPNTHIFLIAGNHDYLQRASYYWTYAWPEHVHMIMDAEISSIEVPELELAVYGCSYHTREITDARYDQATAKGHQTYEILLAHGGDEKHIPIKKNKIESLGYHYIALGHLHKPQKLIAGMAYYAGALEPVDKNDTGKHGYIQGEITEKGTKVSFVPCAQRMYMHEEIVVEETMTGYALKNQIMQKIQALGVEHMYKLTLTGVRDPGILFQVDDMDVYGNIIEVVDCTRPAYDFHKLLEENQENLVGAFIQSLYKNEKDSMEYQALCEGVEALMEASRS